MEAKELRLGNYVFNNSCVVEVLEISDEEIITSANFEGSLNGTINPIPLTEEWLFKFGFEKTESGFFFTKELNARIALSFAKINHGFGLDIKQDGKTISTRHNCCKHVHQLQNLHFTLTGEELSINT